MFASDLTNRVYIPNIENSIFVLNLQWKWKCSCTKNMYKHVYNSNINNGTKINTNSRKNNLWNINIMMYLEPEQTAIIVNKKDEYENIILN